MVTSTRGYMPLPRRFRRYVNIALGPGLGTMLCNQVTAWLDNSGPEWTVKRLKALNTAAMQLRAGNREITKGIYQENSIAYRKGTLYPKGVYGTVFRLYMIAQKPVVLRRLHLVLRSYTALRMYDTTQAQLDKAKKAITSPFSGDENVLRSWESKLLTEGERLSPQVEWPRAMSIKHLKPMSRYPIAGGVSRSLLRQLEERPYGRCLLSLLSTTCVPKSLFHNDLNGTLLDMVGETYKMDECETKLADVHGVITFLQEAGCKARVVANPNAWVQLAFEPLHHTLDSLARKCSVSTMHDQNQGAYFLREALLNNKEVFCFDLSSATDRFPRALQMSFLEGLGLGEYCGPLEEICHDWRVGFRKWNYPLERWSYAVGQPMGVYGSFPLFHMTHISVLNILCRELALLPENSFRVLGDDVVITNPELAKAYKLLLDQLGVESSPSKSIISSSVGEFAGFVGLKTNRTVTMFRPYKFNAIQSENSPLNLVYALGKKVTKMGPHWTDLFHALDESKGWLNPDLSPLLPDETDDGVLDSFIDTTRLSAVFSAAVKALPEISDLWYPSYADQDYVVGNLLGMEISTWDPPLQVDSVRKPLNAPVKTSEKPFVQRLQWLTYWLKVNNLGSVGEFSKIDPLTHMLD